MGMGAILIHVLRLLRHAERNGLVPVIRANNPLYAESPHENLLQRYLSTTERSGSELQHLKFHEVEGEENYSVLNVQKSMTISEARATFNTFLRFNAEIGGTVDRLISQNGGDFVLAVHYRGTDKVYESSKAPFAEVLGACRRILEHCPTQTAFLATDEPAFARAIQLHFPDITFTSFESGIMTELDVPRHFSSLTPSQKAFEALVNIKMLSKTRYLVRTSSYLSAVSCLLNENMKVVTVGILYDALSFPERQIHEAHGNRNPRT